MDVYNGIIMAQVFTNIVQDASITLAKMAPDSVDSSKIVDGSIALVNMGPDSVDGNVIVDGVNLAGVPKSNGRDILINSVNTASPLQIVRVHLTSAGAVDRGEGVSVSTHPSTGVYVITFQNPFIDNPICIAIADNQSLIANVTSSNGNGATVGISSTAGGPTSADSSLHFFAIGRR